MDGQRRTDEPDAGAQIYEAGEVPPDLRAKEGADDEGAERGGEAGRAPAAESARPWRVARSLLVLRDQVNALAPNRRKASDGFVGDAAHASRQSDHNPWVVDGGTGVVTAFDLTHDPERGCDADAFVEAIRAGKDARVKYLIWNRRIASSSPIGGAAAWAWRPYGGSNPHTKHAHVSVKADKARYDAGDPWPMP